MKAFWFAFACLLPLVAMADVYEWVDKNGRTVYSETPVPGAKRIPMPEFAPVPPPPPLEGLAGEEGAPAPAIASLRIVRPPQGETIHDNSGTVPVEWAAEPPSAGNGVSFRLVLDGRALPGPHAGNRFTLQGVERGEHTVQVIAIDRNGKEIATSGRVTFYLWHASQFMKKGP